MMKLSSALTLGLGLALLGFYSMAENAESDPATWPPELDAVKAAPKNHRVIFESAEVRVLSVTVAPGEREVLHHHRWPSVMVIDSLSKIVDYDQAGAEIPVKPLPQKVEMPVVLRFGPEPLHSIHNEGTMTFHAVRIEYKKAAPVR